MLARLRQDAGEQLVKRVLTNMTPSGTTHFVHDLMGNVIAETNGVATGTVREYIWLPETQIAPVMAARAQVDRPLAVVDAVNTGTPVTWWVHPDHLNRPVLMTDAVKAQVWQAVWKPFGETQSITGPAALDTRFPGQWFQIESGLHYNWHRHYDPTTGRYTQPDPLGFVDGPGVYGYAHQNSAALFDLLGLDSGIIVWSPTSWGQSSFGHISSYSNGTSYSYAPGGMDVRPLSDYMNSNAWRDGVQVGLNLTPEQESRFVACLLATQGEYSWLNNSCTDPVERCLREIGFDIRDKLTPYGVWDELDVMYQGSISDVNNLPATMTPTDSYIIPHAPWTFK